MTGENGQFALTRLASTYLKQTSDGRVLSNRAGIEVMDKRIMQLLDRLENGEYPDQLATLRELWVKYCALGDTLEGIKVKKQLDRHFEAIYHDYMATAEIRESLALRTKMVETEGKILKDMHAILTAEDAYKLVAKLQAAIIASIQQEPEIPDRVKSHFLKRIEYEFTRIIGEGSNQGTDRGFGEVIDA